MVALLVPRQRTDAGGGISLHIVGSNRFAANSLPRCRVRAESVVPVLRFQRVAQQRAEHVLRLARLAFIATIPVVLARRADQARLEQAGDGARIESER